MPKALPEKLTDAVSDPVFKHISAAADGMESPAYVIGGFVRDYILQRPCKDIDIVCLGSGIELAQRAAAEISPRIKVNFFKHFGTAQFFAHDWDIEFVGARKESYHWDSRKPVVEEGTLEDDQNRRDFTINAMAISLNATDFGTLVDPFGGLEHLEAKIIRTPLDPDITFSDDPLRMMRAVRFATQLEFEIHPETLAAITRNAARIEIISQERITDELNKIIMARKPSIGFKLLFDTGLLGHFFSEMVELQGAEQLDGIGHKDNFYHTLQVLDNICETTDNLWSRWGAIMHDIAKPQTKKFEPEHGWTFHGHEVLGSKMVPRLFRKLKLPLDSKMKFVQKLVFLHLRPISLTKTDITDSAVRRLLFEAGDDIDELMKLCKADITSKNENKVRRYLRNFELLQLKMAEIEEKDRIRNFQPPVSGELIMEVFGIGPGREIGIIKTRIKDAILDGEIENDYDQAHALMLRIGEEIGLKAVNGD